MRNLLIPNYYVDSIFEINFSKLKTKGIDSLIVDIDNTLVAWDKKNAPTTVLEWFRRLDTLGFKVCLVSNNTKDRVVKFTEDIKLPAIHKARKPSKAPFLKALKILSSNRKTTAIIGDQIFTDVLGGNRMGIYTILVVPIEGKEYWGTKFARNIERFVIKGLKKE